MDYTLKFGLLLCDVGRYLRWPIVAAMVLLCARAVYAVDFIPGIDVSRWQGDINWSSVKNAGVEFAFVKATEGVDFVDIKFHQNMQGARNAGVMVGPYHFCRIDSFVTNPMDPVNEANDFLEAILPYYRTGLHLPPVADVEGLPDFPTIAEEKAFISNWVQVFSNTIYDALGVRPLIYTSKSGANTYYTPSVAAGHDLWIAWWKGTGTSSPPLEFDTPLWDPWVFWQWTDSWSVAGIAGNVDGDVFHGTMPELTSLLLGNDGRVPGDYNDDGTVDAADYTVWRNTQGQKVPLLTGADGNGDTLINFADYAVWKSHFGQSGIGAASSVPEPAGFVLLAIGGLVGLAIRPKTN